ncbi:MULTISPECIES: hypothetical protein [Acinetobacter]|uniref:hypothetical protein n=1 Tax=Acinetobacter TaxID=469 RepID=UPI00149023A8|nr:MULTISPECIES: hypothetical protein [Acinetobacter]UNW10878.1 hypothetical protein MOW14_06855 [Acinetobacter indicus]
MKKLYLTSLMLVCCTAVMANETKTTTTNSAAATAAKAPVNANTIRVITRPEIVGLWGMEIPNNRKCIEYYNFRGDNDVIIKSGQEWSSGIYDYQPAEDPASSLPALIMQIKYDNNEVDCSGYQEDQTGEISQYFVQWKNPHTIHFCSNEKAEQCFATLRRVLP